ncbi:hypothetical protein B0H11DRAFT_1359250 [Mycena galericulata]|nr:hypothetical protein B0H11DRAFT_1359250 [Mycena galericulata]
MYAHEDFSSIPYEGPVSPCVLHVPFARLRPFIFPEFRPPFSRNRTISSSLVAPSQVSQISFSIPRVVLPVNGSLHSSGLRAYYARAPHADFRMIPLEEIDLREIRFDNESSVVDRLPGMRSVRRTYSARLHGRHPSVTVVLYNGDAAGKEWAGEVAKYSRFRHPNLMQFYAASASSSGLYAIIFHDDLLPFVRGKQSHLWVMYILACFAAGVKDICYLFKYALPNRFMGMSCTLRIRSSTGRLCLDPSPDLADCEVNVCPGTFLCEAQFGHCRPWIALPSTVKFAR